MLRKPLHGFTLIELLVVISIVALMTALLLPALKHARESAQRTVCSSNLRSIAQAANVYAVDTDGRFPAGSNGAAAGWRVLFPHFLTEETRKQMDIGGAKVIPPGAPPVGTVSTTANGLWQCPSQPYYGEFASGTFGTLYYTSYLYVGYHENIGGISDKMVYDTAPDRGHLADTARTLEDSAGMIAADRIMQGDGSVAVFLNHETKGRYGVPSVTPTGSNVAYGDGSVRFKPGPDLLDAYGLGGSIDWAGLPRADAAYSTSANAYWW